MLEPYWYLGTIVLFAGGAIVVELLLAGKKLQGKWRTVWLITFIALLMAVTERFALQWQAWGYNTNHILDIRILGAELETYLFSAFTAMPIAIAVILLAEREEAGMAFPTFRGVVKRLSRVLSPKRQK